MLQRVSSAAVAVNGQVIGAIKSRGEVANGLVILVGVEQGDTERDSTYLAQKIVELRIFADAEGKMNRSIKEVGGSVLVISQFTLLADWRKGRRPSFIRAAAPELGKSLYTHFVSQIRQLGVDAETGEFGADMKVSLVNDGRF
jgi:D-tyrosyl-tRNA(Tyr) deacylase